MPGKRPPTNILGIICQRVWCSPWGDPTVVFGARFSRGHMGYLYPTPFSYSHILMHLFYSRTRTERRPAGSVADPCRRLQEDTNAAGQGSTS